MTRRFFRSGRELLARGGRQLRSNPPRQSWRFTREDGIDPDRNPDNHLPGGLAMSTAMGSDDAAQRREKAHKDFKSGNFRDAYDALRGLLLDKTVVPAGDDLNEAVALLERLNRANEIDELLESAVKTHEGDPTRWWFLWDVANQYRVGSQPNQFHRIPPQGFIVAGKFFRGPHRGGGRPVTALDRDRVRALQLMVQALPNALKDNDHAKVAGYLQAMAGMWMTGRLGQAESWRLQAKTDLAVLPDYEEGYGYFWGGNGGQTQGAPVDEQGNPVFHSVPKTFAAAQSDGQRWRWCLEQAIEFQPALRNEIHLAFADFLRDQFDVQTMAGAGWRFGREETDDSQEEEQGIFALPSLGENETIARLATGIKRFKLPDEFNYISIYMQVADEGAKSDLGVSALEHLARIFENRRQYPKAADYWRRLIQEHPSSKQVNGWKQELEQIEANWGRFEAVMSQPADRGATVEYRFRNGTAVELEAHEINVAKLLEDVKAYIKTRPRQFDWQKINVGDVGYRLVTENQKQYVGEKVAAWRMEIKPRPQHFDKRVTVTTPLQKAGAYLLKAQMAGGNTSYIIIWLNDTSIAKKPLDRKAWYFVADAVTGARCPRPTSSSSAGSNAGRITTPRSWSRISPSSPTPRANWSWTRHAADRLPVADHRHDAARKTQAGRLHHTAAWPTWASPASGMRSATTPPTTRPRST